MFFKYIRPIHNLFEAHLPLNSLKWFGRRHFAIIINNQCRGLLRGRSTAAKNSIMSFNNRLSLPGAIVDTSMLTNLERCLIRIPVSPIWGKCEDVERCPASMEGCREQIPWVTSFIEGWDCWCEDCTRALKSVYHKLMEDGVSTVVKHAPIYFYKKSCMLCFHRDHWHEFTNESKMWAILYYMCT